MEIKSSCKARLTQIDQRLKSLAAQERELLCDIIEAIQEINRCKGYLELGYPSLFAYLHEGIGFSEGSAHRRIEAARLVTEIPEMMTDIKSGDLKLTQVALVQQAAREKLKTSSSVVTTQEKQQILEKIAQQTFKQSQQQVAAFFELPIKEQTKQTVQADDSVRLEITLPRQLFEDMKRAQAMMSHSVPNADWGDYLQFLTEAYLKQQTKVRKRNASQTTDRTTDSRSAKTCPTSTLETKSLVPKTVEHFSTRHRKILLKSSPVCQYRDPVTHKQCRSEWFLQIDHIHSRWAGGPATFENAQVLCGAHNRLKYAKEIGLSSV